MSRARIRQAPTVNTATARAPVEAILCRGCGAELEAQADAAGGSVAHPPPECLAWSLASSPSEVGALVTLRGTLNRRERRARRLTRE